MTMPDIHLKPGISQAPDELRPEADLFVAKMNAVEGGSPLAHAEFNFTYSPWPVVVVIKETNQLKQIIWFLNNSV